MELAIATPVLNMIVGVAPEWEQTGSIEDVARIAERADVLGYHHLTCSEHVAVPVSEVSRRGGRYWDPLSTFGFLAARTTQFRLANSVLVLGYHHPLVIVKRYGTLDQVSNGRVILGVGVGSLRDEFDLLAAEFEDCGPRGDDALRAVRTCLSTNEPEYSGPYYSFGGVVVDPCAYQAQVRLWVGGRTLRSLRRAVDLAQGWWPFNISFAQASGWLRIVEPAQFRGRAAPRTTNRSAPRAEPGRRRTGRGRAQRDHHLLRTVRPPVRGALPGTTRSPGLGSRRHHDPRSDQPRSTTSRNALAQNEGTT